MVVLINILPDMITILTKLWCAQNPEFHKLEAPDG